MKMPTDNEIVQAPRQFSLRSLIGLKFIAAILIGVIVSAFAFRHTLYFHSLWSPHALIAAVPILGVFRIHAADVLSGRRLAIISLAIYGVALATPALHLAGDRVFGYLAFYFSFVGIGLFNDWGSRGEGFWYPIACTIGALVNILFLVGYGCFLAKGIRLTRWLATLGSFLSMFVILTLALSTELNGIYLGCGLWVASILALALGSWRTPIAT